jgi:hypothetical protein
MRKPTRAQDRRPGLRLLAGLGAAAPAGLAQTPRRRLDRARRSN